MKPCRSKVSGERILVGFTLFGDKAREVAKWLGLIMSGDETSYHTTVYFFYKSVEGHPVLEVEIQ